MPRAMVSSRGTVNTLLQRTIVSQFYVPGSRKGVMCFGGLNGTVDTMSGVALGDITDAGIPTISCATDATWGNSTMRTRMSTLKTNAQAAPALFAAGKVHLYGLSMGGLCALNWAKANPTLVQSMALVIPAVNPQRIYDDNTLGLQASISAAFAGRPADSETPTKNAASFIGIPTKIYYSPTDEINTVPTDTTDFASAIGATLVNMGNVGHSFGPPLRVNGVDYNEDLAAFFSAND